MSKAKLPKREADICARLRHARDQVLEITQAACAEQIGLDRSTLANYETARTPLRYEIALRFCRQFIISEEWLATGRHDLYQNVVIARGMASRQASAEHWKQFDDLLSIRQCVDLLSDHSSRLIKTGSLFSDAFDKHLAARYGELVKSDFFSLPRILFSDADNSSLAINFLKAIHEIDIGLLRNEAVLHKLKENDLWRFYAGYVFQCSALVFRKLRGSRLSPEILAGFDWLRAIVSDPSATLGPVKVATENLGNEEFENVSLTSSSQKSKSEDVKTEIEKLIEQVKRKASKPGAKSELARALGVAPARISEWLSGEKEPGGGYTLKLLRWVEQQERQK